jgi:hypothetical protein
MISPLPVALFLVAAAGTALAQSRPDISGTWVRAVDTAPTVATAGDAAFRTGDMGSGWGTPLTITQRADSVIVQYVFFGSYDLQPPIRFAFAADGSESSNPVILSHATSVLKSRLAWRDSSLVITTLYPTPREVNAGKPVEVRHTLTLASPTSLVVETVRPGPNGMPTTIQTTYTKR